MAKDKVDLQVSIERIQVRGVSLLACIWHVTLCYCNVLCRVYVLVSQRSSTVAGLAIVYDIPAQCTRI
jgi:hypothetical protein